MKLKKITVRHHSCYIQYPLMNTKIRGCKFEEKQDICMISKYLPTMYLLIRK